MAVKYFDNKKKEWVKFPGTVGAPGKDSYQVALEMGYKGTYEEYARCAYLLPVCVNKVDNADSIPTINSNNLVISGGVYTSIQNIKNELNNSISDINNNISNNKQELSNSIKTVSDSLKEYVLLSDLDKRGYLTDAECVTHTELNNELKKYSLTSIIDSKLSEKQDLLSSDDFATINGESVWGNKNISISLDGYVTETSLNNKGYATTSWIESNYVNNLKLDEVLKPYLKYIPDEYITEDELNKMSYATKSELNELKTEVESIASGLKEASSVGAPGWKYISADTTCTPSGYTNQNNFGIIIANHGVKVTFTTGLISEFDTSDGDYDVYCIMYIDGKIFINMSVYSNI